MAAKVTVAHSIFTKAEMPVFHSNKEWADMFSKEIINTSSLTGVKALKAIAFNKHIELVVNDTNEGVFSRFVGLDAANQGMKLHLIMTRDEVGMANEGTSTNKRVDVYALLQSTVLKEAKEQKVKVPVYDREHYKKVVQPFWYCSEKEPKEKLGSDGYRIFRNVYSILFPGAETFKTALLMAWRNTPVYEWELPDGSQVKVPVEGKLEIYQTTINGRIEPIFYTPNKGIDMMKCYLKKTHEFIRNEGTRSLCANFTHSLDGWIRREMEMRCRMTKARALYIIEACENASIFAEQVPLYERMYQLFHEMGVTSSRWLYLLEDTPAILPNDLKDYLKQVVCDRLPSRAFDIMCVHDEYNATINHLNALKVQYNEVMASIYASHLVKYVNKTFKTHIPQGKFNPEIYRTIRAHDHLVKL